MLRRPRRNVRRWLLSLTAASTAAVCLTAAAAVPASAAAPTASPVAVSRSTIAAGPATGTSVCLTNANAHCLGINPMHVQAVLEVVDAVITLIWAWKDKGKGDGGDEGEEQAEGTEDGGNADAGLCLAATGSYAYMAPCGANGTVWIAIPHNNGYYLESRYSYDRGQRMVLTADPLGNGYPMFVYSPQQPGGPYWQTWSWVYQLKGGH